MALHRAGYDVQTTRIATQPFPFWLACNSSPASKQEHQERQHLEPQDEQLPLPSVSAEHSGLVCRAVQFEALAAKHGISLISIGSSSDPAHLAAIPRLIAATRSTSCTFALPAEPDLALAQRVAGAIMEVAALTGKKFATGLTILGGHVSLLQRLEHAVPLIKHASSHS